MEYVFHWLTLLGCHSSGHLASPRLELPSVYGRWQCNLCNLCSLWARMAWVRHWWSDHWHIESLPFSLQLWGLDGQFAVHSRHSTYSRHCKFTVHTNLHSFPTWFYSIKYQCQKTSWLFHQKSHFSSSKANCGPTSCTISRVVGGWIVRVRSTWGITGALATGWRKTTEINFSNPFLIVFFCRYMMHMMYSCTNQIMKSRISFEMLRRMGSPSRKTGRRRRCGSGTACGCRNACYRSNSTDSCVGWWWGCWRCGWPGPYCKGPGAPGQRVFFLNKRIARLSDESHLWGRGAAAFWVFFWWCVLFF